MKILMATMQMGIGGAETHILELSRELKRQGHDITVVSNGGAYVAELEEAGVRHVMAPLHNKKPRNLLKSKHILGRLIKEEQFDIVHAHARIPAFVLSSLHKYMEFPFVTTAHWVFTTKYGLRYITKWGEKTVAVSEDIKTYLMDNYGIPSSNIQVTINGIDTEKFSPDTDTSALREELSIGDDDNVIVYISRMDESRSLSAKHLIEATPELCKQISSLKIVIVGGGDDYDNVKSMAEDVNSKVGYSCIVLTGARTDINRFASLGRLFVGVSRSALEAMAAEKPVIIVGNEGYIGLFDETKLQVGIDTNFCCRGCPVSSTERIRDDILRFFALSADEQRALGVYGRELIKKEYSVTRMADDTLRVYGWARSKQKEIMISGYYGYRNTGDDAVLEAIISDIRREYESPNLLILSKRPTETQKKFRVKSIGRFHTLQILRHMKHAELLLFGGGTLLQDRTSYKSLVYYLNILRLAKRHKMKTMLYANGLGPLKPKNLDRVVRVLNKVDELTLRDEKSFALLASSGFNMARVRITSDPVFSLLAQADEKWGRELLARHPVPKEAKLMAISIRNWEEIAPDFESILAAFCEYANQAYHLYPVMIPMQPMRDLPISLRIAKTAKCPVTVIRRSYTVPEILSIMKCMEVCVGMRLHSLIFSAIAGVPMIGLSYDPKIDGFLRSVSQNACANVVNVTLPELMKQLDDLMANYDNVKTELVTSNQLRCDMARSNAKIAMELYKKE